MFDPLIDPRFYEPFRPNCADKPGSAPVRGMVTLACTCLLAGLVILAFALAP
jgi:hypothetical protein